MPDSRAGLDRDHPLRLRPVPWANKTKALNNGEEIFLLGVDDKEKHWEAQQQLMAVFRLEDVQTVAALADKFSREIIEMHGGRIWMEATPSGGSRFTFCLPS